MKPLDRLSLGCPDTFHYSGADLRCWKRKGHDGSHQTLRMAIRILRGRRAWSGERA